MLGPVALLINVYQDLTSLWGNIPETEQKSSIYLETFVNNFAYYVTLSQRRAAFCSTVVVNSI